MEGEGARRTEAESFARILRGLSRSVSPDAIVDAIVEELGVGTGADHVAVVRRRPDTHNLEAILSPTRPGAPASRTTMSLRELEDPAVEQAAAAFAIAASRGRRMTAVPIDPDPEGDPDLVPLGIGRRRPAREWLGPPGSFDASVLAAEVAARRGVGGGRRRRRRPFPRAGAHRRRRPPPRARSSASPTGSPGACGTSTGCATCWPHRCASTGASRGRSSSRGGCNAEWPESTHSFLEAAAVEVSAALARVYSMREAETRASTDALTGLPNRRYFDEYLGLLGRRRRAEDRIGVLMVDIDRFKRLNDTFGHAVGDHVLREVAHAIASAVRDDDVPARFGGEEFAVLLKNPSAKVALDVGERVRRAVAALDLRRLGVPGVSVSVGVAVADDPDIPLDVVIDEADRALYRAKRGGRDRVVAA